MLMVYYCIIGNGGYKCQRTFRTYYKMFENIEAVFVIYKGIEAVSGGILYLVF